MLQNLEEQGFILRALRTLLVTLIMKEKDFIAYITRCPWWLEGRGHIYRYHRLLRISMCGETAVVEQRSNW